MRSIFNRAISLHLALILMACTVFVGCGDASVEQLNLPESDFSEEQPDTTHQKDLASFEQFVQERKAKGDTVAIAHQGLADLLPKGIEGYELDIDKAATFETNRFTFSEATRVFYNDAEDYVEFIAGDYVDDPEFFEVHLQRYNLAQDVVIDGVRERKESVQGLQPEGATDFFVWSWYSAHRRMYRVYVGMDYRFFVTIEASGVEKVPEVEEYVGMLDFGKLR